MEQNRIKLLMTDQWCHHKRLTIIRTKERGNIMGWEGSSSQRQKGNIVTINRRDTAL